MEDALHSAEEGVDVSTLARDVYSLLHFPVLCGIVAMAAAGEGLVAHPADPLSWFATVEFGAGLVLYVAGLSVVHRRAASSWLWHRVVIAAAGFAVVLLIRGVGATATLAAGGATLLAVAVYEELTFEVRALRRS